MDSAEYSFDDPGKRKLFEYFPVGILLLDADDKIQFINQNFYEFGICSRTDETCAEGVTADSFKFFKEHDLFRSYGQMDILSVFKLF